MDYLSEEEQFNISLNMEQINRIKDPELREIRCRYWEKAIRIFKDEQHVSDLEFNRLSEELTEKEQKELQEYKNRRFDKYMNPPE